LAKKRLDLPTPPGGGGKNIYPWSTITI